MNGPSGLVYASLPGVYQANGVQKKKQQDVFVVLQVIEAEVLKGLAEERQKS